MSIRYAASPDPYAPSVVSGACSFPLQTQQQVFLDSASAASWEFMSRLSKPPPAFSTLGISVPSHAFTDPELWDTAFDRMSTQAMRPDDQVALMHKSSSALNGTAQGRTACCVRIMPSLKVVQTALRALGTNRRGASYEVWDSASARGQDDVASRVYMPNPTLWSIGGPGEHEVVVCDVLTGQRLLRIKDPKLDVQATALLHAPFRGLMDRKLRVLPVEKPTDLLRIKESQLICTDYVWIGFADGSIRLFPADHHKIRLSDRSAKMAKGEVADLVFELPKYHKASIASISRSPCHKDDEGTDLSTMNRLSSTIEYMTAATSGGSVTNREHLNLMCTASVDSSVVVWDIGKLYQALETLRNEKREEAAMARAGKGPLQSSATSAYTTDVISISGSGTNSSSFTVKSSCTLIKFRPLLRLKGGVAALKSLLWVSSLVTTANYRSWRDAVALSRDAEEPLAPKVVKERREVQELTEFEAREEQRHALRLSERGMKAVEEELKRLLPPLAPEPPQQLRVNLLIAGDNVGTVHMWNLDEELTRSTTELVVEHAASVSPTRPGVSPPRARPSTGRESTRSVSFSPPLMVNAVESPKPVRPPAKKKKAAAPPSPSTTAKHAGAGNASPRKTAAPKRGTAAPLVKSWASLSAASVPDKGMSQLELLAQQRKEGYFTAAASRRPETAGSASFLHSASLHKIPSVWGSSSVFSPQPTWDSALSSPQRRNLKTLGLHDSTSARGVPANRAHSPSPSMPHSARLAKAGSPSPRRAAEPASARRAAAPSPRLGEDGGKKSAHTRRIVSSPRRAPAAGTAVSSPRGPSTTPSGKKDKEKSTRSPSPAPLVPDSSASALVSSRSKGDVSSRGPKVEPERQRVTDYLSRTSRCRIEFTGGVGVTGMAADYPPVVRTTLRRIPDPEPRQISLLEEPTPAEVEQRQLENQFEDLTEEKAVFFVLQRLQLYLSVEGMVLNMRTVPIWTLPDGDKRQLFIQRQQKEEAHRAAEVAALVRPAHLQELVVDGGVALPAYTLQFRKIILEAHSQPVTHLFMDRRRRCVWVARNDGIMSLFSTDTKAILTRVPHPCADRALGPPPQGEWRRQQRNYIGGPNIISTSKVHLEWHRETIGYPSSYFNHVTPVCKRTQVAMLLVAVPGSTLEEDSRYEPSIMEYLGTTAYLNDLAASLEMTKVDGRSDMSDHARAREVQEGNFMNLLQYCRHRSNRVRRAHKEMFDVASGAVVVNIKSTLRASDRFNCIPLLRQCYRLWREHARHFRNLHLLRKQRAARLQITRHATAVYAQACEHHLRSQYFGKWLTRISQKRTEQRDQLLKGIWSTLRPPPPSVALRAILEHYLVRCRMQNAFRRWRAWYTKRSLSHRHPTFTQPNLLVRTKGDASSPNGSPMLKNVDGSNQPAFVTSFVDVLALIYDSRPFITRFRDSRAVTDSVYDEVWMAMIEGAGIEDDTPEVTKRVLVIRNGLVPLLQGLVSSAEDVLPSLHEDQVAADTLSLLSGIQLCLDFVTQDAEEVLLRVHQESCASPLGSPRRRNVGVEDADALLTSFYLLSPKEAAIRLLGVLMSDAALDAECSDSMKEIVREIISIETFMDFARDERTERFRELSTG